MSEPSPFMTFAEAAKEALLIGQRMSLPERFRWLEEAEEFSLTLQAARWRAGLGVDRRLRPLFEARFGPPGMTDPPVHAAVAEESTPYAAKIADNAHS